MFRESSHCGPSQGRAPWHGQNVKEGKDAQHTRQLKQGVAAECADLRRGGRGVGFRGFGLLKKKNITVVEEGGYKYRRISGAQML